MLEITMATKFVVGSNVKGEVAGANWTFLLPRLQLAQVLCVGILPLTSLMTLSRLGQQIWVVSHNTRQLDRVIAAQKETLPSNVFLYAAESQATLPCPSQAVDLVIIAGESGLAQLERTPALLTEIRRVLKSDGSLYLEERSPFGFRAKKKLLENIAEYFGGAQVFWITPARGETQTAVPLQDRGTIAYFLKHGLNSPSIKLRSWGRLEGALNKNRFILQIASRYGVLARCGASSATDQPPAYLQSIMQAAGLKRSNYRWGLSARGDYSSRKVLFYLFDSASGSPEYIVKMTRDPTLNPRLENESRALTWLRQKKVADPETLPQVVFDGNHAGLAIVGETLIKGVPFRARTKGTADCPYARTSIEWLTHLGRETADHLSMTPVQVAKELEILFERFREFYTLELDQSEFLAGQIAAISTSPFPFPLVFQHGDPGTWNVLATPTGIAFLDWEAAERQGMPLWDLFYFLRSYSVSVARSRGTRNRLQGFAQQFLGNSRLSPLVVESVERYCHQVGIPGYLIEPLFYTCWMHRALKESSRLSPDGLDDGSYIRLLRLCIARRNAPTLSRLFSLRVPGFYE